MIFKKEKYIIALEIEDAFIKYAVSGYSGEKSSLLRIEKKEFSPDDPKEAQKILKDLFGEFKKFNPFVILSIPRKYFTVRNMRIPSFDEVEIRNILELQATRQIPYAKEEIVTDFKVLEQSQDGFSNVFFAIVHQDIIKKRLDILFSLGINADVVSISTDSEWSWFLEQNIENIKSPFAILDVGDLSAEVIIAAEPSFVFSRSFSYKHDNPVKFIEELKVTFSSYASESDIKIEEIIVTGQEAEIDDVSQLIESELNLATKKFQQSEKIMSPDGSEMDMGLFKKDSFNSLLGCVFNPTVLSLNFITKNIVFSRQMKALRKNLYIFIFLFVATLISAALVFYVKIKEKKDFYDQIDSRLKLIEPEVSKLNKITKNISLIKNQLNLKGSSIDIIREIYKIAPANVFLTSLNYEEGKSVVLKGNARTLSEVLKFVNNLETSGYFENAKLKYATNRSIKGQELTDFEINAPLTDLVSKEQ